MNVTDKRATKLRNLLDDLLDAYAEIDELLDGFMATSDPSPDEKRIQRVSNHRRDRIQTALDKLDLT